MGQQLVSQSVVLMVSIACYVIIAFPLFVMGQKTNSEHAWFAFVPILNLVLMVEIAGKELWWILLMFVPCVNIVAVIVIWMGIAEAMDKPSWLGILMLVPGINFIIPFYLAFG